MRGVALLLGCLVASCAPDYGHSAFRCDDDRGCPDGQSCVIPAGQQTGRCRRGEAPNSDGVVCGTATCDATQQCCLYSSTRPSCIAAGDVCPDTSALCDGAEDCKPGDRCCADGDTIACDATCKTYACRDPEDCPSVAPTCCDATATQWGVCSNDC